MFLKPLLISIMLVSTAQIITATSYTFTTVDFSPKGLNNAGSIVGFDFVYSDGNFGFIDVNQYGPLQSINDSSQIATTRGIYANGNFTPIQFPYPPPVGAVFYVSQVTGINNTGEVIGYYSETTINQGGGAAVGFTYVNGVYTPITVQQYLNTYLTGINNLGQIVGYNWDGFSFSFVPGFLYQNGAMTPIDAPGAQGTYPTAVNDSGVIVGSYLTSSADPGTSHGFIDVDGSFQNFNVPGALFTYPQGINDFGEIVGYYSNTPGPLSNDIHGFIAIPNAVATPEPSATIFLSIGLAAVFCYVGGARRKANLSFCPRHCPVPVRVIL